MMESDYDPFGMSCERLKTHVTLAVMLITSTMLTVYSLPLITPYILQGNMSVCCMIKQKCNEMIVEVGVKETTGFP